jgi:ABC-type nitrate/sulfonate/bicarbonate transport system substrate-binding protein
MHNGYRARLIAALMAAVALSVCGPGARAETTLTVGKAAPNADPIIPVNVGDKLGIFKKHGLNLKIVDFTGGAKMSQAMTAGGIDIGDGAGTEMAHIAKGAPMLAVCQSAGPAPFLSIGVPYDSTLKSTDELKGKKIGVSSSTSLTDWLAKELVRHKGWKPEDLTRVAIGNGAGNIISAFRAHLVDADIGVSSLFFAMEEKKTGKLLAPVSSFTGNLAAGTLFASKHIIDTNPDAVRAFLAGWIETIAFITTHKAETVKIESQITGFPETVMAKDYDLTVNMFTKDCKFDAESLATLKRSFVDLKVLATEPDMSKLYTHAYLPK